MAGSFTQFGYNSGASISSLSIAYALAVTAHDKLALFAGGISGITITPSDTSGNVYTQIGFYDNGLIRLQAWEVIDAAAAAAGANTVLLTYGAVNNGLMVISESTGVVNCPAAACSINSQLGPGTATNGVVSGLVTTRKYSTLAGAVAYDNNNAVAGITAGTGWTSGANLWGSTGLSEGLASVAPGVQQATFTTSNGADILDTWASWFYEQQASGPVIYGDPTQQTAASGGTATFTVQAAPSNGSLSYQWYRAPITALYSNVPGTFASISGATSASYTTAALTSADNGAWFYCAVTDSNGTNNSLTARVFVQSADSSKGLNGQPFGFVGWQAERRGVDMRPGFANLVGDTFGIFGEARSIGQTERAVFSDWFFGNTSTLTLALTGQSVVSSAGALSVSFANAVAGRSVASSEGVLTPGISLTLAGIDLTSALGTIAPSTSSNCALAGQAITSSEGAIGVDNTPNFVGQLMTSSPGALAPSGTLALSGDSMASAVGAIAPARSLALSGIDAVSSLGTIQCAPALGLTGTGIISTAGAMSAAFQLSLSGESAVFSLGTLQSAITLGLIGLAITSTEGTISVSAGNSVTVTLSGLSMSFAAGAIGAGLAPNIGGQTVASSAGVLAPSTVLSIGGESMASAMGIVSPARALALSGAAMASNFGALAFSFQLSLSGQHSTLSVGVLAAVIALVGENPDATRLVIVYDVARLMLGCKLSAVISYNGQRAVIDYDGLGGVIGNGKQGAVLNYDNQRAAIDSDESRIYLT